MTRIGAPAAVALMALAAGLAASPDVLPRPGATMPRGLVAVTAILFVVTLLDRRAPRRLVAVGVASLAAALAYDGFRGERGSLVVRPGQGTPAFERQEKDGGSTVRPLGDTVVLETIEPDGTLVLLQTARSRRVRVSAEHAATVAGYRLAHPQGAGQPAGAAAPALSLSVRREPAAPLAALGLLVAAIGVAWSRW
jgi:hypothetical protein